MRLPFVFHSKTEANIRAAARKRLIADEHVRPFKIEAGDTDVPAIFRRVKR